MSDNQSVSPSNCSSTLSSFVRRRFAGDLLAETPAGGRPFRHGSLTSPISPFQHVTAALMSTSQALLAVDQELQTRRTRQVTWGADSFDPHILRALELSSESVDLLVAGGVITRQDVLKFKVLVGATYETLSKPKRQQRQHIRRRRQLCDVDQHYFDDSELSLCIAPNKLLLEEFANRLGIHRPEEQLTLMRAFVCDQLVGGKHANSYLSALGDSVLTLMLYQGMYATGASAQQMIQVKTTTLAAAKLASLSDNLALSQYIVGDLTATAETKSTVVQAIFGAVFLCGGMNMVREVNDEILRVCDFEN